ncbi:MAG TPA: isoprenylcysteine carboxylmethyltransferase family protein [Bryobacteraceae bacterium]|nr:isoprenylcysteine carboxylmethyltransferase family protein [Bryobacteraceae bacterium]
MPGFPRSYARAAARLRVLFGFALVAAFAWFSAPDARSLAWGLPVAALGLVLRAWAAGHLAKNQRLATSGPYAYVRNPLYLGTALAGAGLAIASRQALLAALFTVVFVLVYLPAIQLEEEYLRELFSEYPSYSERVRMLWPRLTPLGSPGRFEWRLYWKNEEYQALAGFLAGAAWLVWKAFRY